MVSRGHVIDRNDTVVVRDVMEMDVERRRGR